VNYTDPFVLRGDVLLIPCAELSEDTRSRFAYDEGDVTLSQRHGRGFAQVIDRNTAALLELFRRPRTIVDAVLESSRALGQDAEAWFEALLPHIGNFVDSRVLVPAGDENEIRPQFDSGTSFAGYEIVRCASLVEDSEVYELRGGAGPAALKIARADTPHLRRLFGNEAAILCRLDGAGIAPRLLESGRHGGRPYLIVEWIPGVDSAIAAAQRRGDRPSMAALCASIAAAYAALHERGVLHADVHARNVLVDGSSVKLVDFGYARVLGRPPRLRRAGIPELHEPELVEALRRGRSVPASPAGEQYALAALLYSLITDAGYLDFHYGQEELARQIVTERPRPFAAHGMAPWPEVERILFRALEKTPSRRHASVAAMARRLAAVRGARRSRMASVSAEAHAFLEGTLQALGPGGETYAARYPTASVAEGCAGAAAGLLRIAEVRGDTALLALAEVWQSRAAALIGSEENDDAAGAYYGLPGVHAAGAMIAAAANDASAAQEAVAAFVDAATRPCAEVDVMYGCLGNVLAAAPLLDAGTPGTAEPLRTFGGETLRAVWRELDGLPAIDEGTAGAAHGWAGYLYATMRWCAASGDPLPPRLADRLDQLASLEMTQTLDGSGASWCNGSAGHLFTFLLAHRLTGGSEWLRHAESAAWSSWTQPRGAASLCCGTAGRAYALLALYAHGGDRAWLGRACELANHAAAAARETSQRTNALWKGELGAAVLIADLASPENARMPFF
jgi:serine/threonine-protein kinase